MRRVSVEKHSISIMLKSMAAEVRLIFIFDDLEPTR